MQDLTEPARQRAGRRWQPGRRRAAAAARRGSEAGGARRRVLAGLVAVSASALLAVPVALGAAPPQPLPAQRIDMKVLLIGNAGDGVYDAWKAAAGAHGRAVRVHRHQRGDAHRRVPGRLRRATARGSRPSSPRRTPPAATAGRRWRSSRRPSAIRQLSDNTSRRRRTASTNPTAARGEQGGTHRPADRRGQGRLPLPQGPRAAAARQHDRRRRLRLPVDAASPARTSPRSSPGRTTARYLGINVRANGTRGDGHHRPGQPVPEHHQLLRDGMLSWVTRGMYLGYQRNYLGLDVDDIFLADDTWDAVTQRHGLRRDASSMDAQDVEDAIDLAAAARGLQAEHGLQHGRHRRTTGGNALLPATRCSTPSTGQPRQERVPAGSTTRYAHPNLDCTTAAVHHRADHATTRRIRPRTSRRSPPGSTTRPSSSRVSTPASPT